MKSYDQTVDAVFDRIRDYNVKKKRRTVLACRVTAACCAVSLLGGSVWYLNRPQHDIPVTITPDENEVTTTVTTAPTEGEDTTATTTPVNTTAPEPTTDGGIVAPPTTVTTVAPTQTTATTVAPTTGKTEPPKTTPNKTEPSKTNPTQPTVSQTKPTATQTKPTQTTPTTQPTVPQKIVITADEPDVYGDTHPDEILSLYKKYISPALQEKMKLHSSDNVVFSVIVELPLTVEDYNSFSSTDEELLRLEKERDIAAQEFEDALEQYGWTKEVREKQEKMRQIAREWSTLRSQLENEYLLGIIEQRKNELAHWSANVLLPLSTDTRFKPIFALNANYGFFMELTADEINELAERGGYVIRLVFSDGDGEIIVPD